MITEIVLGFNCSCMLLVHAGDTWRFTLLSFTTIMIQIRKHDLLVCHSLLASIATTTQWWRNKHHKTESRAFQHFENQKCVTEKTEKSLFPTLWLGTLFTAVELLLEWVKRHHEQLNNSIMHSTYQSGYQRMRIMGRNGRWSNIPLSKYARMVNEIFQNKNAWNFLIFFVLLCVVMREFLMLSVLLFVHRNLH